MSHRSEMLRSGRNPTLETEPPTGQPGEPTPQKGGRSGPVPPDNQPGHHPPHEQDRPDPHDFAEKTHRLAERAARERAEAALAEARAAVAALAAEAAESAAATGAAAQSSSLGASQAPSFAADLCRSSLRRIRTLVARPLRLAADLIDPG